MSRGSPHKVLGMHAYAGLNAYNMHINAHNHCAINSQPTKRLPFPYGTTILKYTPYFTESMRLKFLTGSGCQRKTTTCMLRALVADKRRKEVFSCFNISLSRICANVWKQSIGLWQNSNTDKRIGELLVSIKHSAYATSVMRSHSIFACGVCTAKAVHW